jgi:D-aspartate ligase
MTTDGDRHEGASAHKMRTRRRLLGDGVALACDWRQRSTSAGRKRMPRRSDDSPPGLVLGAGITALGVVRALGRSGIPLHVLAATPGFVSTSRWYRPPPQDRPLLDVSGLTSYLRALPIERGVLFPTSDHDVLAVAALPDDLRERFPASQASESVLTALLDKDGLRRLLSEHDVPHPETVPVDCGSGVAASARTASAGDAGRRPVHPIPDLEPGRWFIKPRDSQEFNRRLKVKALRPKDREELRATLAWLSAERLPVVLQEYIPGPPSNHYFLDGFVDREGTVMACFARRRLRMSSPDFGNSCATVSVSADRVAPAVADLERLLRAVSYRGPFDAEFKLDERTGAFNLLEINVRPWWQVEFAALCGVDVVTMAYRDALELDVRPVEKYPIGVEWILPYHDAGACRHMLASGEITVPGWLRSWFRARWGGFAWDDPVPGFAAGVELWRRSLKRKRAASWKSASDP